MRKEILSAIFNFICHRIIGRTFRKCILEEFQKIRKYLEVPK